MVWCLVKAQGQLYLTFYLLLLHNNKGLFYHTCTFISCDYIFGHGAGISENGQSSSNSTCSADITTSKKLEVQQPEKNAGKKGGVGYNFVADDFEGVTVLRTTCLECEHTTERKEAFYDICVPIMTTEQDNDEGMPLVTTSPDQELGFKCSYEIKESLAGMPCLF
jgi:hypothetical protein